MAKPILPAYPQSLATRRAGVSRLDWNALKRRPRTTRAEWSIVQSLTLPFCADPSEDLIPSNANRSEVQ